MELHSKFQISDVGNFADLQYGILPTSINCLKKHSMTSTVRFHRIKMLWLGSSKIFQKKKKCSDVICQKS